MKRQASILTVIVALVGLLALLPKLAGASPPDSVLISVTADYITGIQTFEASGAIVDEGTWVEEKIFFGGESSFGHGLVTLSNYSDTGTITFKWHAAIIFDEEDYRLLQGRWNIISGTGIYANLHGGGGVTIFVNWVEWRLEVTLDGVAHFDQRTN